MNAFELADELDKKTGGAGNIYTQAATMLRQQQAEIEDLKNPIMRAISQYFDKEKANEK